MSDSGLQGGHLWDRSPPPAPTQALYEGPERRAGVTWVPHALMLDEIDYGVVLIDGAQLVLHANRVARARLRAGSPLSLQEDRLRCARSDDAAPLHAAVEAACTRGLRRLITLGGGGNALGVAVLPLPRLDDGPARVLLLLSRSQVCEPLSTDWFARSHGLTSAECRVLHALCSGHRPCDIAEKLGVALSTVRTQIGTIRAKTAASSIRELVQRVAQLPPMVNALHVQ